jgi:hypothetical protein
MPIPRFIFNCNQLLTTRLTNNLDHIYQHFDRNVFAWTNSACMAIADGMET